jgi:acyl carrier protein
LVLEDTTVARDVPGWDSLTHVSLIVAIEREFKIRFTSGEITKLENVGALRKLVESKLAASGA